MNGMIAWFAKNPVAANLMMVFIVVTGIIAVTTVKEEIFPEFELDRISIQVPYLGAAPEEVEAAVRAAKPDVILHTNSTYPCPVEDLNLRYIEHLKSKFGDKAEIGWSGHEYGLVTTFAAVAMGAKWVERHVTLDRNMWGSDQKSSIEPSGLIKLVKGIRDIEKATQYEPGPRKQFAGENSKRNSLRNK